MTLYFAYGSNMHRAAVQLRWLDARAVGPAWLDGYAFFLGIDGWGSVKPEAGGSVHGVLWRLTPRDITALHARELPYAGLYDVRYLPVRSGVQLVSAMIYLLRRRATGRPKPGHVEMIAAAARAWELPEAYVHSVEPWRTSRLIGARVLGIGALA